MGCVVFFYQQKNHKPGQTFQTEPFKEPLGCPAVELPMPIANKPSPISHRFSLFPLPLPTHPCRARLSCVVSPHNVQLVGCPGDPSAAFEAIRLPLDKRE